MIGGFTVVFGGTKGGVPIFGLLTTDVIGGLGVPGITGGLTIGGLGVPGGFTTGETGGFTTGVFFPVILSMTAFVVAPKAAPVSAVPNLLVVPVDFLTTGFAVGVTCVFVVGEVVFDVIDGFAVVVAGFDAPVPVLVILVRGANAPEVVDVTGRDAPPPMDGCLPTPPKDGGLSP
jgi:hypothetical protein